MPRFLPVAVSAVVVSADGVEAMRMAVASHVAQLLHLWAPIVAILIGAAVGVSVFVVS